MLVDFVVNLILFIENASCGSIARPYSNIKQASLYVMSSCSLHLNRNKSVLEKRLIFLELPEAQYLHKPPKHHPFQLDVGKDRAVVVIMFPPMKITGNKIQKR